MFFGKQFLVFALLIMCSSLFSQTDFEISIIQLDDPYKISDDYIEALISVEYTPGEQEGYLNLGANLGSFSGPFDIIVENLYLPSLSEVDTNRYTVSTMYNLADIGVEPVSKGIQDEKQIPYEFMVYIHVLRQIGFYPFDPNTYIESVLVSSTLLSVGAINKKYMSPSEPYGTIIPTPRPPGDRRIFHELRSKYKVIDLDASRRPGVDEGYAGDLGACAAAATATSMDWLERMGKVKFSDTYSGRPTRMLETLSRHMKREKEDGVYDTNLVRGKLDFIQDTDIPIAVKFQCYKIDSATITSTNKRAKAQNFKKEGNKWPDWEFLKQMMKDGEDVEICYRWKGADSIEYGHSVFVSELEEYESGFKTIRISHDLVQERRNGDEGYGDIGTCSPSMPLGVDDQGAMRFGPENKRRITHIAAESPYPPEGEALAAFLNEFYGIMEDASGIKNETISAENEFIEIGLGPEIVELNLYDIYFYGSDGLVYSTINLSDFEIAAKEDSIQLYLYNFPADNFVNDNGAIAISYSGTLIPGQFNSYGGEIYAKEGIAMNLQSTDLGDLIAGESIGLQGVGTNYTQFIFGSFS